ncbi:MAG: hypothetical protein CBC83_02480 [Flavobacteriales bacterium TMED123]|nr:hypothetical protein [Candidatus Neomarinimicrobiota bacterium]OUV75626.1 MAG: hypothetical protein CBC83_02480 [Flavobacteriales bacterium TMED123]
MLNRYHNEAIEVSDRLKVLYTRKDKFSKHATLYTRVADVCLEISELEKQLPVLKATAKWADELYS